MFLKFRLAKIHLAKGTGVRFRKLLSRSVTALAVALMLAPFAVQARFSNDSILIDRSQALTIPIIITAPTVNQLTPATNFVVPITATGTTGENIRTYQFDIFFNPAVVTPTGCPSAGTMTGTVNFIPICNIVAPGKFRVGAFAAGLGPDLSDSGGPLINITFSTVGPPTPAVPGNNSILNFDPTSVQFVRFVDGTVLGNTPVNGNIHLVGAQAITVSPAPPASAEYGTTFTVGGTGGASGQPVVINASGACSGSGSGTSVLITMTSGTGQCGITYNQAGNADYLAAPQVTTITNATPRNITITAQAKTKVYGASDPLLTFLLSNGTLVGADNFAGGLSRATGENVGSYAIGQGTLSIGANYSITFVGASLTITEATITIDADDKTRVYGAADPPFTYVTTGLLPPDTLITPATCSSTATAASPVGGYPITCSGATASANYTITYVGGTLTIGQADQAITVTMPAPASALVNSTFNVAATGGGSGNPVAIAGSGACSGAGNSVAGNQVAITMTSGVGTCVVTYNQAGNANFNAAPQVSSNTTAIDQATVQFAAPTYIDDESQSAQIAISRSGDLSATTTVSFATSVGGANPGVAGTCGTAGADYVAVGPQTVTFLPTETEQFVSIELCRDMLEENLETLNLALSSPSNGVLGAQPTAVLRINDTANQFTSTTPISIGGVVTPYPATINVSGIPAANGGMRVTLYDLTVASPGNIDILLVGPLGQKLIIMGDAGGATAITTPTTLTFEDAAGAVLPQSSLITTGKYEPTTWVPGQPVFAAPAPGGPYFEPGSTVGGAPTQVAFGTANPNGQWRLFVRDDGSSSALFAPLTDQVAGGWGLQFNTLTAAGVSISGRVLNSDGRGITNAVVSVSGNALASPIVGITNRRGIYTIEGLQAGGTYVITVASRRFMFNAATRVITLTDNATDVDFVADPLE